MQHRLLQQKRQILQKQCAMTHQAGNNAGVPNDAHSLSRRQMLRQASYKIAQQQPVLPPLPLNETENKDLLAFQVSSILPNSAKNRSIFELDQYISVVDLS